MTYLLWWLCWYDKIDPLVNFTNHTTMIRKSLAFFSIGLILFGIIPISTFWLSQWVGKIESYPWRMDVKNVNGLWKNLSTDFFGGAMTFSYPFIFPSGSRDMTPSLEISYNSNNADAFSPYGYGFSLSLQRIQRSAKKWVSELYTLDEFSVNGQDLILSWSTGSEYRSKDASDMSVYIRDGSWWWIVYLPDGKIRKYWVNPTSRIADGTNSARIYAWLLEEEWDQFGYKILYQYISDWNQPYLSKIQYGYKLSNPSDYLYEIRFDYVSKTASLTSYRTQFEISTKKLLSQVGIFVSGNFTRGYAFKYDALDTPISHLTSIQETGPSGEKLPEISFSYGQWQYQHSIVGVDNHRWWKALYEYSPSTGYRNASGALRNESLPFTVQTISKQTLIDDVTGLKSVESYTYDGGHYYYDSTDIWWREYVWFARVNIIDDKAEKNIYFHQSQSSKPNPLKFQDHIQKKWRVYLTEIKDIQTGKLLSRENVKYEMRSLGNRYLVYASSKIASSFGSGGDRGDRAVSYEVDDAGNILKETKWWYVQADLDKWTFIDIPWDTVITESTYLANASTRIANILSTQKLYGFSGELLLLKKVEYDNTPTNVILWLPTSKIQYSLAWGDEIKETILYSSGWLPREKKDNLGNTTKYTYDDRDISLLEEINPLNWKTEYVYDYALGKLKEIKNQNNITTKTVYDIWWREITRQRINDNVSTTLTTSIYDDNSLPNSRVDTTYFTENDTKTSYQYSDGWWRVIMSATSTEKIWQYSVSQIRYDSSWNPIYAWYPIFSYSPDWNTDLVLPSLSSWESYRLLYPGVSYVYDALDRIISERTSRGMTQKTYWSKSEIITDALGNITKWERDAYGNLAKYTEILDGRDIITSYGYDALGRTINLSDAYSNTREWGYDHFWRLKNATDIHGSWDTTYGIRKYEYDGLSRLKKYTNAEWKDIAYQYDSLSRPISESYVTNSGTWMRSYTYDQWSRSLGTVSSISDADTTVSYTYDPLWRKTTESRVIGWVSYTLQYGYNIASLLTTLTYPDGGRTDYLYKKWYIEWVDYINPSGILTHLISDISYAPNATMQSIRYGNGVIKNTNRDPNNNYRLTRSTASASGQTFLDTEYRYDAVGNMDRNSEWGIEPLRKTIDYTYDDLYRLSDAQYSYNIAGYGRDQSKTFAYTYNDIGNIMSATDVGSYGYAGTDFTSPHAVTTAWDMSYTYDQAGNTLTRQNSQNSFLFGYSPYGEMLSSMKNGEEATYTYDQSRRRVSKISLGITEHHVIDGYEVEYESGALLFVPDALLSSTGTTESGSLSASWSESTGATSSGALIVTSSWIVNTWTTIGTWIVNTWTLTEPSINTGSTATGTVATSSGITASSGTTTGSWITSSGTTTDSWSTLASSWQTTATGGIEIQTGSVSTDTGSGVSYSGETDSGSYIVIASYIASTASWSTPVTLTTTLTHIMLGDEKIATFQTQTDDTPYTADDDKLVYHIADHLNSSSLDLSSTWLLLQATDYQPFGKTITYEVSSQRVKGKKWWYRNKYLFANKQLDEESDLQYFEKRYYDNRIWRFTTEDPVFWEVGLTKRPSQYFTDPQQWNSYSYVRNNPVNLVDPTGEIVNYSKSYTDNRTRYLYYQAANFTLQDADTHYRSNNGTAIQVSFNEINTSFINPASFDVINNKINAWVPWEYTFQWNDAIQSMTTLAPWKDYQVYWDLTFKAEWKLFINNDGSWNFNWSLKVYDDIYDFTVSKNDWSSPKRFWRNVQTLWLVNYKYDNKGTSFDIQIRWEKKLQGSFAPSKPTSWQGWLSTNSRSSISGNRTNLSKWPLLR